MQERPLAVKRNKEYGYTAKGDYFITVCVNNGQCLLTRQDSIMELSETGRCVRESILRIPLVYPNVALVKYTILPNHFHMLLRVVSENTVKLPIVIEQTKGVITKRIGMRIFQKQYYEKAITDDAQYAKLSEYIDVNASVWKRDHYGK